MPLLWALRDELDRWMATPYDYVGAPWAKPYAITIPPVDNAFAHQTFHIAGYHQRSGPGFVRARARSHYPNQTGHS